MIGGEHLWLILNRHEPTKECHRRHLRNNVTWYGRLFQISNVGERFRQSNLRGGWVKYWKLIGQNSLQRKVRSEAIDEFLRKHEDWDPNEIKRFEERE